MNVLLIIGFLSVLQLSYGSFLYASSLVSEENPQQVFVKVGQLYSQIREDYDPEVGRDIFGLADLFSLELAESYSGGPTVTVSANFSYFSQKDSQFPSYKCEGKIEETVASSMQLSVTVLGVKDANQLVPLGKGSFTFKAVQLDPNDNKRYIQRVISTSQPTSKVTPEIGGAVIKEIKEDLATEGQEMASMLGLFKEAESQPQEAFHIVVKPEHLNPNKSGFGGWIQSILRRTSEEKSSSPKLTKLRRLNFVKPLYEGDKARVHTQKHMGNGVCRVSAVMLGQRKGQSIVFPVAYAAYGGMNAKL